MASVIDMTLQSSLTGNAAADAELVLNNNDGNVLLEQAEEVTDHLGALGTDTETLQLAIDSFSNGTTTPDDFRNFLADVIRAQTDLYESTPPLCKTFCSTSGNYSSSFEEN